MGIGFLALPFFAATGFYVISIMMFWLFFKDTSMPEETAECEHPVDVQKS
jgi:hypothetical protein